MLALWKVNVSQCSDARGDTRTAQPAKEPSPAVYRKLEKAPAKNTIVLVPASTWPTYACNENDGQGWLAKVVSNHGAAVRVCFETACTANNRPYEDVRLEWQHLCSVGITAMYRTISISVRLVVLSSVRYVID